VNLTVQNSLNFQSWCASATPSTPELLESWTSQRVCAQLVDVYEIRGDVVWPSELALPPRPPAVVYLDLNHFVYMARIVAGKPAPGYAELLEACRKSFKEGRAVFPLEDAVKVFGTFMPRRPQDLTEWLNTRPAPA
jgi:hypothetical protein